MKHLYTFKPNKQTDRKKRIDSAAVTIIPLWVEAFDEQLKKAS